MKEQLLDDLESIYEITYLKTSTKKRTLAQYDSYFLFNDILCDFWKGNISDDERMFYFPLYFWWNVTGIIPLRPKELIITKRECLTKQEDGWYLTLMRDDLKGNKKNVAYKIKEDNYEVKYKIPDNLAIQIQWYINATAKFESTEINTLFVTNPHYHYWNHKKHCNSRYLTYVNLNTILRYFFDKIIMQRYGLKVIYNEPNRHLCMDEIQYIRLGDTRHIALINIMLQGGTPTIAMVLAGHNNTEMAAHYYSNISNLIECQTYKKYRLVSQGDIKYNVSRSDYMPQRAKKYSLLSDGNFCFSDNFRVGDIRDCINVRGPKGEIGYCPNCKYFNATKTGRFNSEKYYKRGIKTECKNLADAVQLVRMQKGDIEDICEVLLRLKGTTDTYKDFLNEKMTDSNKRGEPIWEENI